MDDGTNFTPQQMRDLGEQLRGKPLVRGNCSLCGTDCALPLEKNGTSVKCHACGGSFVANFGARLGGNRRSRRAALARARRTK